MLLEVTNVNFGVSLRNWTGSLPACQSCRWPRVMTAHRGIVWIRNPSTPDFSEPGRVLKGNSNGNTRVLVSKDHVVKI